MSDADQLPPEEIAWEGKWITAKKRGKWEYASRARQIRAAVILADPIFQGLAISLLFGLASSTLLTVLVIPAIYIALRGGKDAH